MLEKYTEYKTLKFEISWLIIYTIRDESQLCINKMQTSINWDSPPLPLNYCRIVFKFHTTEYSSSPSDN